MTALALATSAGIVATLATSKITVQTGDTVSELARSHGVTVDDVAKANALDDPDVIRTGQVLVIPPSEAEPAAPRVHVVAAGETLSEIAVSYGVRTPDLSALNGLQDPDHILAGASLHIDELPRSAGAGDGEERPGSDADADPPSPVAGGEPGAGAPLGVPAGANVIYIVRAGDILAAIADRFDTTAAAIAAANDLRDVDVVIEGQRLSIPSHTLDPAALELLPERLRNSPDRLALLPVFDHWAADYEIDPALFKAMTWVESGWQNSIVSPKGAVGIGQLMPDTVDFVAELLDTELDPDNPIDNIRMSARFLSYLIGQTGGDVETALAAYHQGLASVRDHGPFRSSENYVAATLALSTRF